MPSKVTRAGRDRSVLVVSLGDLRALVVDEGGKTKVLEIARPPSGGGWVELDAES
jgi:hypothetical protein